MDLNEVVPTVVKEEDSKNLKFIWINYKRKCCSAADWCKRALKISSLEVERKPKWDVHSGRLLGMEKTDSSALRVAEALNAGLSCAQIVPWGFICFVVRVKNV